LSREREPGSGEEIAATIVIREKVERKEDHGSRLLELGGTVSCQKKGINAKGDSFKPRNKAKSFESQSEVRAVSAVLTQHNEGRGFYVEEGNKS